MLKQPLPTRRRWIAGAALVTTMTAFAGVAAWAAQPPMSPAQTAPAAATAAATPGTPVAATMQPPKYPAAAFEQELTGKVVLLIDIDAQGNPTAVAVERAEPEGVFEAEAAAAAWKWKFTPETKDGKPVASQVRVPVQFELDGPPPEADGTNEA